MYQTLFDKASHNPWRTEDDWHTDSSLDSGQNPNSRKTIIRISCDGAVVLYDLKKKKNKVKMNGSFYCPDN